MNQQLTLDLPLCEAYGRDDFFVSPANALALATLENCAAWPGQKAVLCGPEGSGKTHLAHIWRTDIGAEILTASNLSRRDLPELAHQPVAVEDIHQIAGDRPAEEALFHLHNLMAERQLPLLITSAKSPLHSGIVLPDLASRLQAATLIRIDPPDDSLLRAVMAKMFADRQINVAPAILEWAALRMTRSLASARALVNALDARSFQEASPITRQMAEEWLEGDTLFPLD